MRETRKAKTEWDWKRGEWVSYWGGMGHGHPSLGSSKVEKEFSLSLRSQGCAGEQFLQREVAVLSPRYQVHVPLFTSYQSFCSLHHQLIYTVPPQSRHQSRHCSWEMPAYCCWQMTLGTGGRCPPRDLRWLGNAGSQWCPHGCAGTERRETASPPSAPWPLALHPSRPLLPPGQGPSGLPSPSWALAHPVSGYMCAMPSSN